MKKIMAVFVAVCFMTDISVATLIEGRGGDQPTGINAQGAIPQTKASGAAMTAGRHGKFMNAVLSGNVYYGANPLGTAVTTQAGLSATTPALTLWNPPNSGKNLVILEIGYGFNAAPAAAAEVVLAYNINTTSGPYITTNANVVNALITGQTAAPVGQVFRVCTLPTVPIAFRYLSGTTGAAAIGGVKFTDDTDGKVIVPPGGIVSLQTSSAAALYGHFLWEEIPAF